MSNGERIAQVAHDKWATVSDSLRSLLINEQMRDALKIFWQKISEILFFSIFYTGFFILKNERFAHYLIFGEWCMQIAQFTHQKWAMWANHSGRSPKMSDHDRFTQVAHQKWANERITCFFEWIAHSLYFLQKTSNSIRKPMSEFPALIICSKKFVYKFIILLVRLWIKKLIFLNFCRQICV